MLNLCLRLGASVLGAGSSRASRASDEPGLPLPVVAPRSRSEDTIEIKCTRKILEALAAIGTFGGTLSFAALHSAAPGAPGYLAWAFWCFVLDVQLTLVWRAALDADVGPLFRSRGGRAAALVGGFSAIAGGALFVGLSLTASAASGVRAAGIAVLCLTAVFALLFAAARRLRTAAGQKKNPALEPSGSSVDVAAAEVPEIVAAFPGALDTAVSPAHGPGPLLEPEDPVESPVSVSSEQTLLPLPTCTATDAVQNSAAASAPMPDDPFAHASCGSSAIKSHVSDSHSLDEGQEEPLTEQISQDQ